MAFSVNHLLNTNSTTSQEKRNNINLKNFILEVEEAILHIDEFENILNINEQFLASMQA